MPVPPLHLLLLFAAAFAAGAINSVAGGGTLLTFPALLAALGNIPNGPIIANGTSTVALVPGSLSAFWGYRAEMTGDKRGLWEMALPSLVGGAVGAFLATHVSSSLFKSLVPWLIFGATFLFLIQDPVRRWVGRDAPMPLAPTSAPSHPNKTSADERVESEGKVWPPAPRLPPSPILMGEGSGVGANGMGANRLGLGGIAFQFCVAVYGGFFGAGIGILMLAALGFLGQTNIHRMNGLKNFAAVCINGVGALTFICFRKVDWTLALLMAVAAILGGYGGAGLARRLGQANVRRIVIAVGLIFGGWTLYGQLVNGQLHH